jgi:L-ascorbate peroxidase
MRFQSIFLAVTYGASHIYAQSCPTYWTTIARDLSSNFLTDGECNSMARQAIRYGFHDAFAWTPGVGGGADGSLLLNTNEINRSENENMRPYHEFLTGKYSDYQSQHGADNIGAADLVQFASQVAIRTCPGGPLVKTVIGRNNSANTPPTGQLPPGFGAGSDQAAILANFQSKGFSPKDLAALLGAHTVSRANRQQNNSIPTDGPQDSTPGRWDIQYYKDTYDTPAEVFPFDSDRNCAVRGTAVGDEFRDFRGATGRWNTAFTDAAFRLSLVGIEKSVYDGFVDCTSALPGGSSRARTVKAAPINDRVG